MDRQKLEKYLTDVCNMTKADIEKYQPLIASEIKTVQQIVIDNGNINDERIITLAGARINYNVLLSKASEDGVSRFSAGDISISENGEHLANAKSLIDIAYKNCVGLLKDDSFAFLGV